mmetsp:Transcript_14645/g.18948  ORF Transcript_14645/g.18948 Transcript_14645/m.18948 type:complete len:435 (-) Transcript_14645:623-1927(-)
MDDMFDGGDSDSEFGFDMGNVRADSAEVDDFTEVDSDDAEAQGTNINRKLDEFAMYNTRKQKNDQNDYERDVDESHDDDDDDDDDDYENNNKGNLDIDMNSTTDTLVVKRGFLREFDTDEYSVPEELEHLRGTEILRDLKQSPISWSRKKQRVQEARAIAKATVFTSKEKIWRIVIPLVVAILLHGINLLSRKRLKLLVGLFAMMASVVVKVPQIRALEQTETSKGVSRGVEYCQTLSFTISVMNGIRHHQSVLTWGDELFVFAQNIYLISLIWKLSKTKMSEVVLTLGFYLAYIVSMGMAIFTLPHEYLWPFQVLEVALLNPGYLPQIYQNNKNEHSGCLSGITQSLSVFMHLAHMYTNLADGVNIVVGIGYLISATLNIILLLQIIAYAANSEAIIERELELARMPPLQKKMLEAIATNTIETMFSGTSEML